ncbi:beta strand repeat-containing protein [Luteolibacter luteus]|uniref:ESPR domain-containing protein n=1 Tax=Luteolibacter luteus TaxID=2728835 RepID=A0A858RJI8_9BACT|nr:autotransporter-associated beta strand repeat-containing protein [Luteolibacter luteus]QJE97436.1 hypothetical protein HHL09_17140 [Luteolibacter luteus]
MRTHFFQGHVARRASLLSLASTVAVLATGPASAADISWSATAGSFSLASNWAGGVIPGDGDNAVINNGGTASIDASHTVSGLHTGSTAGGGGTFELTAGDFNLMESVKLGVAAGSNGSFSFTGGTLFQEDGDFIVADASGSTGDFSIAPGLSFTRGAGDMIIGRLGTGSFTLGGSLTSAGDFIVGERSIASSGSTGTVVQNGGTFVSNGDVFIGRGNQQQGVGGNAGSYELAGAVIIPNGNVFVGTAGATGLFTLTNGFVGKSSAGQFVVGEGNGGNGTITQISGFINSGSEFVLGKGAGASGTYTLDGQPPSSPAVVFGNALVVGLDGGAGVLELKGGSVTKTPGPVPSNFVFAEGNGSTAVIATSGGRIVNTGGDTWLGASGTGVATWTISGSSEAVVTLLELGHADSAKGTLNLDGGSLQTERITQGLSTAASTVNLNGGILKAAGNSTDFMSGLAAVNVKEGGASIDTNGFDITIDQTLSDGGGGFFKGGDGTLSLEGASNHTGDTIIQKGTLVMNGTLPNSPVTVNPEGTLSGKGTIGGAVTVFGVLKPGEDGGALTVTGNVDFSGGVFKPSIDGATVSPLLVSSELNIENATLDLSDVSLEAGTYTIASFGTLVGTSFLDVVGLPDGFEVGYTASSITISGAPAASAYDQWAALNELEGDDALSGADPDEDGIPNGVEFIVGGNPNSAGDASKLPGGEVEDGKFVFTYRRMDEAAEFPQEVQYGPDLIEWLTAEDGVDGVEIEVSEDAFEGGDLVRVSVPMVAGPRFVRLQGGEF